MIVRRLRREEIPEAEKIRAISFHYRSDLEATEKWSAEMSEQQLRQNWGCFDDGGRMMGTIINNDFETRLDGQAVRMGGIGAVSTLPEYRYGGAIRAIFASLLRTAREEGEVLSALYPFSHEFYRKAGYEACLPVKEYEFPPSLVSGLKHTGWTRRMEPGESIAPLREIYGAFAGRYNLMLCREDGRFGIGDPFKDQRFTMLLGDGRGARAYLQYATEEGEKGKVLKVRDIGFLDWEGFLMCLGYLGRMSADYSAVRMALPDDVPLHALVPRPYELKCTLQYSLMARLTNVPEALVRMAKPADADFTVRVTDDFLPENSGTYRVTADAAARTEGQADLVVSQKALTLLVLGTLSMEEAEYRADVQVNGRRDLLNRVFVRKPAFIADHF